MSLKIVHYDDVASFVQSQSFSMLTADEANNSLAVSIVTNPSRFREIVLMALFDEDTPIVTLIRTPPQNFVVNADKSKLNAESMDFLTKYLFDNQVVTPGLFGEKSLVENFNASLSKLVPFTFVPTHKLQVMICTEHNFLNRSSGFARNLKPEEIHTMAIYQIAMAKECCMTPPDYEEFKEKILKNIARYYAWEDNGVMVSCMVERPEYNGVCICGVYTPPKYRGKGYCKSLIAEYTNNALTKYPFCVLHVDSLNPISNHVYSKVGFVYGDEMLEGRFYNRKGK